MQENFKKKSIAMEKELKKKCDEVDETIIKFRVLDQQNQLLQEEREKMKLRFNKLKTRKGRFDHGTLICMYCGQDY